MDESKAIGGSKAIIEKILSDAKKKVKEINAEAKSSCAERISDAEEWAKKYTAAQTEILKKDEESIVSGKKLNAELDVKKAVLKAKREAVEKALSLAYEKLVSLDKKIYLNFVKKMIDENADDGDTIVLSSDGVISASDLNLKDFKAKDLTVSEKKGDFKGGVMLVGKKSDKDLSFESVIAAKREELTAVAVKILF